MQYLPFQKEYHHSDISTSEPNLHSFSALQPRHMYTHVNRGLLSSPDNKSVILDEYAA